MPSDRSWRTIVKSCWDSPAVRLDVGSSMMMSFASKASAVAISTSCICPAVSSETGVGGGEEEGGGGGGKCPPPPPQQFGGAGPHGRAVQAGGIAQRLPPPHLVAQE